MEADHEIVCLSELRLTLYNVLVKLLRKKYIVKTLFIIIPCYNEGACLDSALYIIWEKLQNLIENGSVSSASGILLIDDGSTDDSWAIIKHHHEQNQQIKGIRLASNRGKEFALLAGVLESQNLCDMAICMDADLQHDINAIEAFIEEYNNGSELVCGLKKSRGKESLFRRITARLFYWVMEKLGAPVMNGHSDYCLISNNVINALSEYRETHMMFRGILHQLGFERSYVYFDVKERIDGCSKMTLKKLLRLSIDAVTSFSVMPLRMILLVGFLISLVSLFMLIRIVWTYFCNIAPNGWATITFSIWFLGGIGMICLAVVGEYIGKIYMETKRRPRYYIKNRLC